MFGNRYITDDADSFDFSKFNLVASQFIPINIPKDLIPIICGYACEFISFKCSKDEFSIKLTNENIGVLYSFKENTKTGRRTVDIWDSFLSGRGNLREESDKSSFYITNEKDEIRHLHETTLYLNFLNDYIMNFIPKARIRYIPLPFKSFQNYNFDKEIHNKFKYRDYKLDKHIDYNIFTEYMYGNIYTVFMPKTQYFNDIILSVHDITKYIQSHNTILNPQKKRKSLNNQKNIKKKNKKNQK